MNRPTNITERQRLAVLPVEALAALTTSYVTEESSMWSQPIPIYSLHGVTVGHAKTDGRRVSMTALESGYGEPRYSVEAAVSATLGDLPPILQSDWVNGLTLALEREGYRLTLGGVLA